MNWHIVVCTYVGSILAWLTICVASELIDGGTSGF